MTRHAEIEDSRETLRHIVAMLFAMAAIAAYVSTRPHRVRRGVLPFLLKAEIVVWGLVLEDAYGLIAPPEMIASTFDRGDDAASAAQLAVVLRALALTLAMRFALHRHFADAQNEAHRNHPYLHAPSSAQPLNAGLIVRKATQAAAARSPPVAT